MQKNIIIAVIISAVVFGGAGFMLGKKAPGTASISGTQSGVRGTFTGGARSTRAGGGGMVGGEIIAKDANSITVRLRGNQTDGSAGSKIIFLSDATLVSKSAQGSTTDLSVGTEVSAFGTANPDGSVNAQSIQIRPEMPRAERSSSTPTR